MEDLIAFKSRREIRREDRREKILNVAENMFLHAGYAGTAMSDVATKLGGSKATLWSYFPSKEKLFSAVVERASLSFRKRLSEILHNDKNFERTLRQLALAFIIKITLPESLALHRLVAGEAARFPEVGSIFFAQALLPTRRLLADFLASQMKAGFLRDDDPLVAAQQLLALCMSGCHQSLVFGFIDHVDYSSIERDALQSVNTFLYAYANGI